MRTGKGIYMLLLVMLSNASLSQQNELDSLTSVIESDKHDTIRVNAAIEKASLLEMSDYDGARNSALWALSLARKIGYERGVYESYYAMASMHYESSMPDVMLLYIDSMMSMEGLTISDEQRGEAFNLLGIAHYTEGDLIKAIKAWKQARELLPPKRQAGVISNIGNIYLSSEEMEKAVGFFMEAAAMNERDSVFHFLAMNYYNIATCYPNSDTLHLYYLRKCLKYAHRAGYDRMMAAIHMDMIRYYTDNRQLQNAALILDSLVHHPGISDSANVAYYRNLSWSLYRQALAMEVIEGNEVPEGLPEADRSPQNLLSDATEYLASMTDGTNNLRSLYLDNQRLGDMYMAMADYRNSAERYKLSIQYKDTLAVNKAQFILKEYEREQQIAAEMQEELRQANERQQQRFRLYTTLAGGGLMLLLAIGLWSRLRFTRRTNAIITREKDRSEELLLNILPEEVADELKDRGAAEAQLIDETTVLFTDFKGFTVMAEQLSPKDLVNDLNVCFSEFDRIVEKYGIEKIKTIGDAYMAAGGLPTPNATHATDVVNAAFEMRDFVQAGMAKKIEAGLPYFEIRIGVHTGPVVAGIVGVKKFQYDIWGDTVNTASRMESSGEVGKINISQATYELIKDDVKFTFESRGKIEAKGKGEIMMYFVTKA